MFALMPRQWTPVIPLTALNQNPMPVELAGERLVLFRDQQGEWHALRDSCPHRGAALSLGRVTPEGHLQCRYHGWCFSGQGRCERIPLNEQRGAQLARASMAPIPLRVIAGALWLFTGTDEVTEPLIPESLSGPPDCYGTYSQDWRAHWTRAVENFIDFAHPAYLHESTIGGYSRPFAESGGISRVEIQRTEFGMAATNYMGNRHFGFRADWYRPNLTCLHFGPTPDRVLHVFSIPVNEHQTRVMTVRRIPPEVSVEDFEARFARVDHTILDEDRQIVESQVGAVDLSGVEVSVGTDAPSLEFRRWYKSLMSGRDASPAQVSSHPAAG